MPERPSGVDPERLAPVLANGAEFTGLLVLHGATRIDGGVRGEIVGADVLCVGPGALVEAHLSAEEIVVAGEVRGNLTGGRRIELRPGARVLGSVRTARLTVAEGAVLEGSCRTGPDPGDPPETPSSA